MIHTVRDRSNGGLYLNMLKQQNIRFLVLFAVFIGCRHQGMLASTEAEEFFPEKSLCPWNEERCADNNENDHLSREAYGDGIENIFDERDSADPTDTQRASNNWQRQVFDGMLEGSNSRDDEGQKGRKSSKRCCESALMQIKKKRTKVSITPKTFFDRIKFLHYTE